LAPAVSDPEAPLCGCKPDEIVSQGGLVASGGLTHTPAQWPIWDPLGVPLGGAPRDFYGLAEIATAIYVKRKKVAKWYRKGRLPEPTDVLATGPIWSAEAIDAFLHPPPLSLRDVLPRFSAERGSISFTMPPRLTD
jgi:hypothetical protein